jgi:hypothetical protein
MNKNYLLRTLITGLIIVLISTVLYLYTAGYRLQREEEEPVDIRVTGMISAKSIPESASVYLDDELVTATDDSIPGIPPGNYNLKIKKSGFTTWEKEIEVFPELVTDITAILISETPRIEPLTNTGARDPVMSPSLSALAYFSKDEENPGVWVMPLLYNRLNFFSSAPEVVLEDTNYVKFSEGLNIEWAPNEKEILVEQSENSYYLVDLVDDSAMSVSNVEEIRKEWQEKLNEDREDFMSKAENKIDISEEMKEIALDSETSWAPDGKKFLYTQTNNEGMLEYRVFNMERPLPVGEKVENIVLTTNPSEEQPKLSWYSDSFHLIVLEGGPKTPSEKLDASPTAANTTEGEEAEETRPVGEIGTISLIRIDGTNKTEIYNNIIYSDRVFSSPGGDKVVLLTSFKSEAETNLYTVSIR